MPLVLHSCLSLDLVSHFVKVMKQSVEIILTRCHTRRSQSKINKMGINNEY